MRVSIFADTYNPKIKIPLAPDRKDTLHIPYSNIEFGVLIEGIKGKWKDKVEGVRNGTYNKVMLPCFTPSGVFRFRAANECYEYSGIVSLDYDHAPSVFNLKEMVKEIPFTLAAFYSPRLKGVKVFVKSAYPMSQYKQAFEKIREFYDDFTGHESDKQCSDISRLCYVSYDVDPHYNHNCDTFLIDNYHGNIGGQNIENTESVYAWLNQFTAKVSGSFLAGNRNNFLFRFSCNCNRYGIAQDACLSMCNSIANGVEDITESEINKAVSNAYKNAHEFAKLNIPKRFR
ncbi:MAG: hypothetical protein K9I36_16725 [Bacteroidia bacterium]|nr:hypothetical protein [Bacteroidia bacterium]